MMFLLDTNVVAELRKAKAGKADPNVVAWNESLAPHQAYLSVITVLELERGVLQLERRDITQGALLRKWLNDLVLPTFKDRVLSIDSAVARRCAMLHIPDPKSERDALIAATALVYSMAVVTRNVADFELTDVEVLNPWEWKVGCVTLHEEIQEILHSEGNRWMTTSEIAELVNRRNRYQRRDRTEVPASQIAARAKSYEHLFSCDLQNGSLKVRLHQVGRSK